MEKGKMGILLIATGRFRALGAETTEGSYETRKLAEAEQMVLSMKKFCTPVYPGPLYTRENLEQAIELFQREKVDCVFALFLSWTEDFLWVRFLRDMPPIPVLFASKVREAIPFTDTEAESDFVEFLSAGGLVGALEGSGSVRRFDRPMLVTVIGAEDRLIQRAEQFCQAAALRSRLRKTSFALMACYNEVMWSTYVDPYLLFQKAGPELRFLSVATLTQEIERIPAEAVERACRAISARYEMLPDVDEEKFKASMRASIALENVGRNSGAEMVVLNDVDPVLLTEVGLRPGFIPTPEGGDVPVVPEGDIGGGLAVYILRQLSGKAVSFIEPFYLDQQNDCFAGGHAGPNDYTDPAGKVRIARDVRFAKTSYKYAGAPFAWYLIPPGRKTMLHVSQKDGSFQMVCGLVDALPSRHFITSYSHGLFRPAEGEMIPFFQKLLDTGVTQHYGIVEGDYTAQLEILARLMGFSFTRI